MKTIHIYGLAAMLAAMGIIVWMFAAVLWYIGLFLLLSGAVGVVIGLFRFWVPGYVQASQARHEYAMAWKSVELQERVIAHGERHRGSIKRDINGTIEVIISDRVQVAEERPMIVPPQTQLALPAGPAHECLNLSHDYQPHADVILSQRGMIVGISGSGKSNSVATLHEELGRLMVPFLLIDTEGEYGSLCNSQYLPRGQRFDSAQVMSANGKDFGWYIIENHVQAVLDVTSYEPDEAAYVVVNALAGLQQWEEELENENRLSFMVTLSEAGAWFPQSSKAVPYSAQAYSELQTAFFTNLVPRGRKRGLGLVFDLQRPAQVDKRLMQTSWKILHRQTEPREIEMYKTITGLTQEEIMSLGDGEAYIFSSQVSKHRTQIRRRYTQHEANTPGLESIRRRQYALPSVESFGRNAEIPVTPRNAFVDANKPFRLVSKSNTDELKRRQTGVPEATKQAIVDLYRDGKKRTEIQDQLDLNGDEYWMVKVACDEYDQQRRRA
jgi:hypothetical protein